MHFNFATGATAAIALASQTTALNILLGNDDGFGSAQIRETYRLLKANGHDVVMVSEADNESGQGGRSVFTVNDTLLYPSEYNLIPAGAPSFGQDPNDSNIFYYNGTPAATMYVGIDYVIPTYTNWTTIDLVVAGPNFGNNLGPFFYTLSGTAGYTYNAIGRGIPAIAFSGGNNEQRSYQWINATTPSGYPDPATIQAQLAVDIVQTLINNTASGSPILPQGYGISVNTPYITSLTNDSCVNPPFIQTRLTGEAIYDQAVYNATTGLFKYANYVPAPSVGGNTCINGNCALPGEQAVINDGCQSAVSVFTVDYDAPIGEAQDDIRSRLEPLVSYFPNSTSTSTASNGPTATASGTGSGSTATGYTGRPGWYGPPYHVYQHGGSPYTGTHHWVGRDAN